MLLNSRGVWLKVAVFKEEKLDWRLTKMPHFKRHIGIDYSGAETADSSCKGLRVFMAEGSGTPVHVQPRKYRRRRRFPMDDCGVDCTRRSKNRPSAAALLPLA